MKRLLLAIALLSLPLVGLAQAPVPGLISYQGRVTDASGALIGPTATGPVNRTVIFRIWNSPTASAAANRLYSESQVVTISNGEFSVLIGSGTAVSGEANPGTLADAFNATTGVFAATGPRFLGITIDDPTVATDPEISPRQQFVTTPYAARAKVAEGVTAGAITGAMMAGSAIGTAQIADRSVSGIDIVVGTVGSTELLDGGVATIDLANQAVTTAKLADSAVGTTQLADSAVTEAKIATGAVSGAKIANGTITADKLAAGAGSTSAYTSTLSVTSGRIGNNVLESDTFDYSEQLLLRWGPGAAASISTPPSNNDKVLAIGYVAPAATPSGYGVIQGHHRGLAWTGLKLNPNGGFVEIGPGGLSVGTITSATTFAAGLRANTGLNLNTAGTVGTTVTIQGGKHPSQPTVEDSMLLVLKDFAGNAKMQVSKDGALAANSITSAGPFVATSSAVLYGQFSFNTTLPPTDTTMVVKGASSSQIYLVNFANEVGASCFYVKRDGNAQLAGVLLQGSDRRLKHNIAPVAGSLEKLLRLRSVTFEYNDTTKYKPGVHAGFIAQEMEEVFPEWVFTEEDGMKSIGFRGFESYTVQALRELRAEKDAQLQQRDATIAALEKNIAAMKSEAAETKAQLAALQQAVAALSARTSN